MPGVCKYVIMFFPRVCECGSDLGAVGTWWRRKHVRGTVVTQRGRALRVDRQRERDRRVLVVGVEAQTLPSVAHVVCRSRAEGVRGGTGGAVVVVRTRVQLIQRDGADSRSVHGEGVAGIAGKVRERVGSGHGAHVHLRIILLTAVILQRVDKEEAGAERDAGCEYRGLFAFLPR